MSENKVKADVFDPMDLVNDPDGKVMIPLGDVGIDNQFEPQLLSDILSKAGILAPQVKASELVDQVLIITGLKTFNSSYQGVDHCYYALVTIKETGEKVGTVLGGGAVVDMLDILIRAGIRSPLICTLREVKGGAYGRYYVLE